MSGFAGTSGGPSGLLGELSAMETQGRPTEKWMTLIPLTVFVFIVVVALGGPDGFVRTVGSWTSDLLAFFWRWLREL